MAAHRALKRVSQVLGPQIRQYSAPAEHTIPAAKQKYVPTSGQYPKGFLAGSSHAGVKESNTQYDDIALVVSETPCAAAGVFTRNIFQAAPVTTSRSILSDQQNQGNIRGVVVNSGCANAVTGTGGRKDSLRMASTVDRLLGYNEAEVPSTVVMSTGVIGKRLPIDKIVKAIPKAYAALGKDHQHWMNAARAICTTDTFPKLISRTFELPSHPKTTYTIAGMTKGAGMIHPNMATLLGIICTDVNIAPDSIRKILLAGNKRSFNCISVDGDTSTNDTVALLANGAAAPEGAEALSLGDGQVNNSDAKAFVNVLSDFMADLAQLVVRDGEGATKFVTIRVASDTSYAVAKAVSESIATSPLVKTALYGKDANWGRILCAIGYTPGIMTKDHLSKVMSRSEQAKDGQEKTGVNPSMTSVSFKPADGSETLKLLVRGEPQDVDEVRAKEILEMEDLEIVVELDDLGPTARKSKQAFEAKFWTCDFSHEYVTINGDYRT